MASKRETKDSRGGRLVRKRGGDEHPVEKGGMDLQRTGQSALPAVRESRGPGFFSFRYSYREISSSGGQTRIRAREHRFEDGKLSSEEFEGTMDGGVYEDAVKQTRDFVTAQVSSVLGLICAFMPFSSRPKDE